MKHAGAAALDHLEIILRTLREFPQLRERSTGVFYWKSKPFLHFHEDHSNLYADLRTGAEFERFPVNSIVEKEALLDAVRLVVMS